MDAVSRGGDRQTLHERIRIHSHAVTEALKAGASENDLLVRLRNDSAFTAVDFNRLDDQKAFVGRAPQQVEEFIAEVVEPIRLRYRRLGTQAADLTV
jgi:adenylosuccinate lyase